MTADFIALDFHHGLPSHSFIDKKSGVRINVGRAGSVPKAMVPLQEKFGGVLVGLQESGMPRDRLDMMCSLLALNCNSLGLEVVIAKSDRPFDSQWYFFGDIEGLLRAARDEHVRPPFGTTMHENISRAVDIVLRKRKP